MMHISMEGLSAIKAREGLVLKAYKCPAGVWTIGYGHTGKDVHPHLTISRDDAIALLMRDICAPERFLNDLDYPYTQGQFDALVSFIFNIGLTNFKNSTMCRMLQEKKPPEDISEQFPRWKYATVNGRHVVLPGLVRRRESEQKQFLQGREVK